MLVGKYRFQKDVCSLQSGGEQGQFSLHFEARKRHCTGGQPTPKGRGNLNPHGFLTSPTTMENTLLSNRTILHGTSTSKWI